MLSYVLQFVNASLCTGAEYPNKNTVSFRDSLLLSSSGGKSLPTASTPVAGREKVGGCVTSPHRVVRAISDLSRPLPAGLMILCHYLGGSEKKLCCDPENFTAANHSRKNTRKLDLDIRRKACGSVSTTP